MVDLSIAMLVHQRVINKKGGLSGWDIENLWFHHESQGFIQFFTMQNAIKQVWLVVFFLPLWKNDGVEWVSNSWDGWKFPTVSGKSFFPFHGSSHQQPEVDVSIKTMDLMDWWRLMSINLWLPKFHVELVMKSVQRFFAKISWQNF